MDATKRTSYPTAIHAQQQHQHQQQQHQQQPQQPPPPPPHLNSHHGHHVPPQLDQRAVPPQPSLPPTTTTTTTTPQQQQQQPHHHQTHSHSYPTAPPPPPPPPSYTQSPGAPATHFSAPPSAQQAHQVTHGPALPPIQQSHGPMGALSGESHSLPPFRHSGHGHPYPHEHHQQQPHQQHHQHAQQHPYPPPPPPPNRDAHDYPPYPPHDRSGHATPAPVSGFHHDPSLQRTPTTPTVGAPYPPAGQQMDHTAYHGYPPQNGFSHGPPQPGPASGPSSAPPPRAHQQELPQHYQGHTSDTPNHYVPPSAPTTSTTPQQMYAQPAQFGPTSNFNSQSAQGKRKQMRATQACEQCRQRKQKCDEGNPCSFCKENNMTCQYRDTPPAKVDKNMERLLQYMETFTSKFDSIEQRLQNLEQNNISTPFVPKMSKLEVPKAAAQADDSEQIQRPDERKQELDDHRTAPHKLLLLWPSVRKLLNNAMTEHISDSYVAEAEDRPILRLYTKGEGIDEHDGTQPGGPASPACSEESESVPANTPPDGIWGYGLPQTPNSDARRSELLGLGGLKPDGSPDLDVTTINMLYDSYMKHIHVMHPFLDKRRLRKLFDSFIKRHSTANSNLRYKFAVGGPQDGERPLKRQRSNGSTPIVMAAPEYTHPRRDKQTERSPSNAVIWLVLALGKICLHKEALPSIVSDSKPSTNTAVAHNRVALAGRQTSSSPSSTYIKPSPMSPKSTPITQPTPSSIDGTTRSRRASMDGPQSDGKRNIDVIPGLAYYAKAVEILGDQGDGNDLIHAQMFLLAGLYKGQLARVKESMSWITMASRAVMNLLDRYKLYNESYWSAYGGLGVQEKHAKGQARIKDKRHSLIVLASWTALQLESDILAELRLPSSGIQTMEQMLLMPHDMSDNEKDNYDGLEPDSNQDCYDTILLYYTSQLYLRRRLNRMHKEIYSNYTLNQTLDQINYMLMDHNSILDRWREKLPPHLQWEDSDPPPREILPARLRGKYWGARYVVNRPFLDYCLHIMPYVTEGHSIEDVAIDGHAKPRDKAEIQLFRAIALLPNEEVWQAARRCIFAAMHSTVAFDGIQGRLYVTNIHGTAHAQFGNMLVLSACYYNKVLNRMVDPERYSVLLNRTINFLRKYTSISKTCEQDVRILEAIRNYLFPGSEIDKNTYCNDGIVPNSANSSFNHAT